VSLSPRATDDVQRAIDIAAAATGLIVLSPVLGVVAAVVAAGLGRPVLFRQPRPGRYGKPFTLVKFRTMRDVDEQRGVITDADRLTHLGRVLRATSLDELPTLWNVLRGEMSLVGPRPLLMRYLDRYTPAQARRHLVRPGITGLAQVRGRNALSWEERLALDVWYVDHRSLALNLRICAQTALIVLRRIGITAPGESTMPEFTGTAQLDGTEKRSA
jgi:lipopolysaccharide/colanic/teichoic acid biosynthesis glycosyltransferase